jgi:hypothetical protein
VTDTEKLVERCPGMPVHAAHAIVMHGGQDLAWQWFDAGNVCHAKGERDLLVRVELAGRPGQEHGYLFQFGRGDDWSAYRQHWFQYEAVGHGDVRPAVVELFEQMRTMDPRFLTGLPEDLRKIAEQALTMHRAWDTAWAAGGVNSLFLVWGDSDDIPRARIHWTKRHFVQMSYNGPDDEVFSLQTKDLRYSDDFAKFVQCFRVEATV